MCWSLIFCSFFLLSKAIVLLIPRFRDSCHLLKEEGSQEWRESFTQGRRIAVLRRQHTWCLEDETAEQVNLVDCLIFQEAVLQMGFQKKWDLLCRQTIKYLVRGMPGSAGGTVVKSETGETKGFPWSNPEWGGALGGTPKSGINLLRKPLSGKCGQRHYRSMHGHK